MDLLADVPKTTGQQELHLRVNVFHVIFKHEFPCIDLSKYLIQRICQSLQLFSCQKTDRFQHPDMCL